MRRGLGFVPTRYLGADHTAYLGGGQALVGSEPVNFARRAVMLSSIWVACASLISPFENFRPISACSANATVSGGILSLTAKREDAHTSWTSYANKVYPYTSGMISSDPLRPMSR